MAESLAWGENLKKGSVEGLLSGSHNRILVRGYTPAPPRGLLDTGGG